MINAAIFDMDGLLIDTEPYWQATERKVFHELGIRITKEMQVDTFGLRSDEQIRHWYNKNPWKGPGVKEVEEMYNEIMLKYFREEAELMEGALQALDFFSNKDLPMALASSSNMELINAFLDRFGMHHYFLVAYSAEFEKYGKPHPGVYLETARRMNANPVYCVALEDSFHGVIAAKAARMKTIAVPEHADERFGASDIILNSLSDLNEDVFEQLMILPG
ncbi:MAG: hexitol phosphatase HxpB [Bacteroidales bacterium]|nr:hexitol phosphatase HxpB [Bacteroidales bacterium]